MAKDNINIETPSITIEKDTVVKQAKKEQLKKIVTVVDHTTCIGGVWYTFKKGVQQNVPTEVKEILLKANLLGTI